LVVDLVHNPILTHANPIEWFVGLGFANTRRTRNLTKRLHGLADTTFDISGEHPKLFGR
jgi:hypothetical protein